MWAYAPRASSVRTMSISSSKFNLHRKHGNTGTQFWFTCVVSLLSMGLFTWGRNEEWDPSTLHQQKLRVPQTTHNIYWFKKIFKKKKAKRQWDILLRKSFLLTPHYTWKVSMARFLSHAEITESPTWPIKKRKQPSKNFFLYENKKKIYLILLFPAKLLISQKVQMLTHVLNSQ